LSLAGPFLVARAAERGEGCQTGGRSLGDGILRVVPSVVGRG
jgi:hypothetical protein